jgi:hypothetical protein
MKQKLCECGCGKQVKNRFVHGHNAGRKIPRIPNTTVYCACGCGELTPLSEHSGHGRRVGKPLTYIRNHHLTGTNHYNWKGGVSKSADGYVKLKDPSHSRADHHGYVLEHVAVAQKALGHDLPEGAIVHHVNEIRDDNRNPNLVICQDKNYHKLLHRRMRAYAACGHADWYKCAYCGHYDDPSLMKAYAKARHTWHQRCKTLYDKKWKQARVTTELPT